VRVRTMEAAKQRTQCGYCLVQHHDHSPAWKGHHMRRKR